MTESSRGASLKPVFWLTFFLAVGWVLCFWPARSLRGTEGVWWMSVAVLAVLVPGWVAILVSNVSLLKNDLSAMLVQTMVRLFSVATTALVVRQMRPELGIIDFFGWLILFYLLALIVEVAFLKSKVASSRHE